MLEEEIKNGKEDNDKVLQSYQYKELDYLRKLDTVTMALENSKATITNQDNLIEELKKSLDDKIGEISNLKDEVIALTNDCNEKYDKIEILEKIATDAKNTNKELESKFSNYDSLKQKEAQLEKINKDFDDLKKNIKC